MCFYLINFIGISYRKGSEFSIEKMLKLPVVQVPVELYVKSNTRWYCNRVSSVGVLRCLTVVSFIKIYSTRRWIGKHSVFHQIIKL